MSDTSAVSPGFGGANEKHDFVVSSRGVHSVTSVNVATGAGEKPTHSSVVGLLSLLLLSFVFFLLFH